MDKTTVTNINIKEPKNEGIMAVDHKPTANKITAAASKMRWSATLNVGQKYNATLASSDNKKINFDGCIINFYPLE
jgi:hypothetical protein